jgi:hypothetical protein
MKTCDIYICGESKSPHFKFIGLFDKSFNYSGDRLYSGFMNVNIGRVKLISIISDLRKAGVACFSVPVEYRDNVGIDVREARSIAEKHAESIGFEISGFSARQDYAPLFWVFDVSGGDGDRVGGVVIVDRLDGHIWETDEYEEYMYDYNNIF